MRAVDAAVTSDALFNHLAAIDVPDLELFPMDVTVFRNGNAVIDVSFDADVTHRRPPRRRWYCAGKPAVLFLLDRHLPRGDLDRPIADLLELADVWEGATVWDLVSHRAGLPGGPSALLSVLPRRRRDAVILNFVPTSPRGTVEYDQLIGWELTRAIIERVTDTPIDVLLEETATALHFPGLRLGGPVDRWHVLHQNGIAQPLVGECTVASPWERNLGVGWSGTTSDLAALGWAFIEVVSREQPPNDLIERAHASESHFDRGLQRWCRLGGCLMLGLADHGFGDHWSPQSIGHAGYQGCSWFGVEPLELLSCAVHHEHIIDADLAVHVRRPAVADALHRTLEG